jgi:hypothetical protein
VAPEPRLWALLIGIDHYPGDFSVKVGNQAFTCRELSGCVRDIRGVQAYLKARLELPDEQIAILTSSTDDSAELAPTYQNLLDAFHRVLERAQEHDQIYVHYSGHGAAATALFKPFGETDEALVPCDLKQPKGGRLFRDVELAFFLHLMAKKNLRVTLVLDACHSGGMTRDGADAQVRWASVPDNREPSLLASAAELKQVWTATAGSWSLGDRPHTLFAACRPDEKSYERPYRGEIQGAFTRHFLDVLITAPGPLTHRALHQRLLGRVHGADAKQTPVFEGDEAQLFLGSSKAAVVEAITVFGIDGSERVRIGAGAVHGLSRDAQLLVHPPDAVALFASEKTTLVRVDEVKEVESLASVIEAGTAPVVPGSLAVLVRANLPQARGVRLVVEDGLARPPEFDELAAAIGADPSGLLRLDGDIDYQARFERTPGEGDPRLWFCNAGGEPLGNLPPLAPGNVQSSLERLRHLARYQNLLQISNEDPASPEVSLAVDAFLVPADYQDDQPPPLVDNQRLQRWFELEEGARIFLRLQNLGATPLSVVVLDFEPDWRISRMLPRIGGALVLAPGQKVVERVRFSLPNDIEPGTDVLKVIATTEVTDFEWLLMEAIDLKGGTKAVSKGLTGVLAAAVGREPPNTRKATAEVAGGARDWATAQLEVRIKRKAQS